MEPMILGLAIVFCAATAVVGAARAEGGNLTAGVARADITPDPDLYNRRAKALYGVVEDPLSAKSLVLGDGHQQVAIVSCDILNTSGTFVAQVREGVASATGIPATHVLINATHSHSAPRAPDPARPTRTSSNTGQDDPPDPVYDEWAGNLPGALADVVKAAQASSGPATLSIGRAYAGEWLFNRRPIDPDGNVVTTFRPENPYALPDGHRFGIVDPTLTVLPIRTPGGEAIATLFSVPCHAVSNYGETGGLSADWPGAAYTEMEKGLGGVALFLQGCAGDVVPARRGLEASATMGRFFTERTAAAVERCHPLGVSELGVHHQPLMLPLNERGRERSGSDNAETEIQVITYGTLALVALSGEPLNALAREIQARSPYPHTLVIGYSNGGGVGYVGMPGDRARGGYEGQSGRGADECGLIMVETAVRMLSEAWSAEG